MNNNLANIPPELRALPQWVCAGSNKIPINPRTGKAADPTNPATGGTFDEAVRAGMQHVGFILSTDDPFVVVDLDNPFERRDKSIIKEGDKEFPEALKIAARHTKIYEAFDSYTEVSQSGAGVHIVLQGTTPCGVRRDKVEIYSTERYIIFTGNVLKNAPVTNCQDLINELFAQVGSMVDDVGELIEEEPVHEDAHIWSMATNAANGEKFRALCSGDWQQFGYESQSEADYGLLSMLAFYTRSNEQVRRMFRLTHLGQRDKAQKNDVYINRSLKRMRSKEPPLVDISKLPLVETLTTPELDVPAPSHIPTAASTAEQVKSGYDFPPGLIGEIAEYAYSSAIRPVREVALVAALAYVAGICGRAFNISGTGLNLYVILLALTGRGKEGASTAIDALTNAVRQRVPMAEQFIGPAAFASGQALIKTLDKSPCFVSVLGEFGLTLQQMCDHQAPGPLIMLRRVLLDIYAKSGHSKVLRSSVYSDADKNTKIIQAPNVTLLGEATPDTFFNGLDASHISEGLIPRFSIVEYKGKRPPINKNAFHPPSDALVDKVCLLITAAITAQQNSTCTPVAQEVEATVILDALNVEADKRINSTTQTVEAELWNRAHLKALKMAALLAAGVNPHAPVVTPDLAQWSVNFVRKEIGCIMQRFTDGDVGTGELKQEAEIRRLFTHFQSLSDQQKIRQRCPEGLLERQVAPFQYFNVYCRRLACFKNDRRGPNRALKETLENMVKSEALEMIPLQQLTSEFKMRSPIYYPGPTW